MKLNDIIQLKVSKYNYKPTQIPTNFSSIIVDINNYKLYMDRLLNISNIISNEIQWDGIPDKTGLYNRFRNNSVCQIWNDSGIDIGWGWYNKNITFNWVNNKDTLNTDSVYSGGFFVSRKLKSSALSSTLCYNMLFNHIFFNEGIDYVYLYCDKWNRPAILLSFKIGAEYCSFLN